MPTKGGFIGLLVLAGCGVAAPPRPTDPLTDQEIRLVADTLRSRGLLNETSIVTSLTLRDGEKVVDPNRPGDPRQVQAQLYDRSSGIVHDVALILPGAAVRSTRQRSGLVPPLMSTDFRPGVERLAGDSAWLAALRRRGLSTDDISIELLGPGVLGLAWEQPGHRYGRFLPTLRHQEGMTAQPVEGIVGVVDLTEGEVVRVIDSERVPPPLSRTPVPTYPKSERGSSWSTPTPSYRVTGNEVSWSGWEFRFEFDAREGMVLRDVAFGPPGNRARRILARASLAEMLVPYGDPGEAWSFRSIFDVGEFGMGSKAATLIPGADLPEGAERFGALLTTPAGLPRLRHDVIGLYERDGGLRWRHAERGARARELVLRSVATLGNYDYGFSWVFSQDGVIAMEIDLTGQLQVKGVSEANPRFGTAVGPHLSGVHHQHFFSFRLDFDVDGPRNRLREVYAQTLAMDSTNPHGTAFGAVSQILTRESLAIRDLDPSKGRLWIVENPHVVDSLGNHPGYLIAPGPLPDLHADARAFVARRGAFATHALWATARREDEKYSAGEFPGQDPGGAGLPTFVADDESIDDTDLVVWYSTGMTHFPRPEEWPMMPVTRIRFELKPVSFLTLRDDTRATP